METKKGAFFVSLDFETTGLSCTADEPVQVAFCGTHCDDAGNWQTVEEVYESLLKTERKIPSQATQVHGITNSHLSGENVPNFEKFWSVGFQPWLARSVLADEKIVLTGHNLLQFDFPLLLQSLFRHNIVKDREPRKIESFFHGLGVFYCLDSLQWAKLCLDMPQKSLSAVYEYTFRRTLKGAHQAKVDALAVLELLESGNIKWRHRMHPILPCIKKALQQLKVQDSDKKQPMITKALAAPNNQTCPKCKAEMSPFFNSKHNCSVSTNDKAFQEIATQISSTMTDIDVL